jgi:hypothetical protein
VTTGPRKRLSYKELTAFRKSIVASTALLWLKSFAVSIQQPPSQSTAESSSASNILEFAYAPLHYILPNGYVQMSLVALQRANLIADATKEFKCTVLCSQNGTSFISLSARSTPWISRLPWLHAHRRFSRSSLVPRTSGYFQASEPGF